MNRSLFQKLSARIRRDYSALKGLSESDLAASPLEQFERWFKQAVSNIPDANAMTLATASSDGAPSGRMVLLKDADAQGFVFFTNYDSRKGRELEKNPRAALVFPWHALARQVIVEGRIEKISAEESDAYFATRPRDAQIGAWASHQSEILEAREALEKRLREVGDRFKGQTIPRPPHWGGYRLIPAQIEFWQGRANRLHDRLRYVKSGDGGWMIERLAP